MTVYIYAWFVGWLRFNCTFNTISVILHLQKIIIHHKIYFDIFQFHLSQSFRPLLSTSHLLCSAFMTYVSIHEFNCKAVKKQCHINQAWGL